MDDSKFKGYNGQCKVKKNWFKFRNSKSEFAI